MSFLDDETDDKGFVWKAWQRVIIMDYYDSEKKRRSQEKENDDEDEDKKEDEGDTSSYCWIGFTGEWGNKATKFLAHPGQFGPTMKGCYHRGDVDMTPSNTIGYNQRPPQSVVSSISFFIMSPSSSVALLMRILVVMVLLYYMGKLLS